MKTARERFDAKWTPEPNTGCWLWTGSMLRGYGQFSVRTGVPVLAHRWALENHLRRTIRKGMSVLHKCDTRACVNPAHLYEGTHMDNMRDMKLRRILNHYCKRGHKYNKETTYFTKDARGHTKRTCNLCRRITNAARRSRNVQKTSRA